MGCSRVICMALAWCRLKKARRGLPKEEQYLIRLDDVEDIPDEIEAINNAWFDAVVVGLGPGADIRREILKLMALASWWRKCEWSVWREYGRFKWIPAVQHSEFILWTKYEWLVRAVQEAIPDSDVGDIERAIKELIDRQILEHPRFELPYEPKKSFPTEFMELMGVSAEFVEASAKLMEAFVEFMEAEFGDRIHYASGYDALKAWIRLELLRREDRAKKHAIWVKALWAIAKEAYIRGDKIEFPVLCEAIIEHALAHLEEGGRDEDTLRKGLEAGLLVSTSYHLVGLVAFHKDVKMLPLRVIPLARALKDHIAELKLIADYITMLALIPTEKPEDLKELELLDRARELVKRIETSNSQEEADKARYHYCIAAMGLALKLGDEEGLKLLRELEKEFASRIYDEALRLNTMKDLIKARITLLLRLGKPVEKDVERLRTLSQALSNIDRAVLEVDVARFLLLLGGKEKAREALELLSSAISAFSSTSDYRPYLLVAQMLACLAHLVIGEDDTALKEAVSIFRISSEYTPLTTYEWICRTRGFLSAAYACLVTKRAPEELIYEGERFYRLVYEGELIRRKLKKYRSNSSERIHMRKPVRVIYPKPTMADLLNMLKNAPKYIRVVISLSRQDSLGELIDCLARYMIGYLSLEELLYRLERAKESFNKLEPFIARLVSECIKYLRARGHVDEEFLREIFIKILAALIVT